MATLISASEILTCLGDGESTFASLLEGACGARALRYLRPSELNVSYGYQIVGSEVSEEDWFRASKWLKTCVSSVVLRSGVDPAQERVVAVIGTGLREMRSVELAALASESLPVGRLHFRRAVIDACPGVHDVITISNACSAGGHALALAQELIQLGEADAVIVGAADTLTASMVAMVGRFANTTATRVQPFDAYSKGVLLGDGAAALVLVPDTSPHKAHARLLSTGLSCDATHETVPDPRGVQRALEDAYQRAGRIPGDIDLILAHGTGTAHNDPMELSILRELVARNQESLLITGVKGAVGHNSGAAALVSLDVALRCFRSGRVPHVVGLECQRGAGEPLPFVVGSPASRRVRSAQINAFGFGGVNAITLVEAIH